MRTKANEGFTLIELIITIALIGIIAGFAIPQFGNMIDRNRVVSTTNSVVGLLNFARSEAIRRNVRVQVDFSQDPVEAQLVSDTSVIRVIEPLAAGTTIDLSTPGGASPTAVMFRSNGTTNALEAGGIGEEVLVRVCSGDVDGREIVVDPGGRLNTRAPTTACP